jgi:hypothetical protein
METIMSLEHMAILNARDFKKMMWRQNASVSTGCQALVTANISIISCFSVIGNIRALS